MPCSKCGKCVIRDTIAYCKCKSCNKCHMGSWCPNGKTWLHQLGTLGKQNINVLSQSHGSYGWIPAPKCKCKSYNKDSCEKTSGGYYSHCGNTCCKGNCNH